MSKSIAQLFKVIPQRSSMEVNVYDLIRGIDELLGWYNFGELDEMFIDCASCIEGDLFSIYWNTDHSEAESDEFSKSWITGKVPYWSKNVRGHVKHIRLLLKKGLIEPRKKTRRDFDKLTIERY